MPLQPGHLYLAPKDPPRCPTHGGPMRHHFAMDRYECKGWDGEGCDHHVNIEDLYTDTGAIINGIPNSIYTTTQDTRWP